jgi:hypothetical protein
MFSESVKYTKRTRKTAAGSTTFITAHADEKYETLVALLRQKHPGIVITSGGFGSVTGRLPFVEPPVQVYPTELVAKAKYEMEVFERVSSDTGAELIAEVERLRAIIADKA